MPIKFWTHGVKLAVHMNTYRSLSRYVVLRNFVASRPEERNCVNNPKMMLSQYQGQLMFGGGCDAQRNFFYQSNEIKLAGVQLLTMRSLNGKYLYSLQSIFPPIIDKLEQFICALLEQNCGPGIVVPPGSSITHD